MRYYDMAGCASRQDVPNPALWLGTRAGKIELSCLLGIARCVPAREIFFESCSLRLSFVISAKAFLRQEKDCQLFELVESENKTVESIEENENTERKPRC